MKKVDKDIQHKINKGESAKNNMADIIDKSLPLYEKITGLNINDVKEEDSESDSGEENS